MKYFLVLFVFLFIGIIPCYSKGSAESMRGNGNAISQERIGIDFNGVVLEGVANIKIHFGNIYKIVVFTDSNLQEYVTTTVTNNILYINTDKKIKPKNRIQIDVYMSEIKLVELRGVGDIILDNGNGTNMEIISHGIGKVDTQNYQIDELNITLSGVGDVKIWAKKINGTLSGIGNILYKGDPLMNINRSGIGKIKKME